MLSTQNLTSPLDDINEKGNKKGFEKKNNEQRGALRIEIREMDGHSARGGLYYLLTLKIITGRLARAECGHSCRRPYADTFKLELIYINGLNIN